MEVNSSTTVLLQVAFQDEDNYTDVWEDSYEVIASGEAVWGVLIGIAIVIVNGGVMGVIGASRSLWKPRHIWVACLCCSDLFVSAYKCLDFAILWTPTSFLCAIHRSILGIPYVANLAVLTLLSIDRFIAVRFPFAYAKHARCSHVIIAYILLLLLNIGLALLSVMVSLKTQDYNDGDCGAQPIQLPYLTSALLICSCLSLVCNIYVLVVARSQLKAMTAGHHETGTIVRCPQCGCQLTVLQMQMGPNDHRGVSSSDSSIREKTTSLPDLRSSLQTIPEKDVECNGAQEGCETHLPPSESSPPATVNHSCQWRSQSAGELGNTLVVNNTKKKAGTKLHWPKTFLHEIRFGPSVRFARTVLLILIPTWIFILPIVIIVPMHQSCAGARHDHEKSWLNCQTVSTLWAYLLIHMRSVLPLQALCDTFIYACSSTEFKDTFNRLLQRWILSKCR